MSEENKIGNIHGKREETVRVEWQIPEFLSLSGRYYYSPVFCLSDSRWFLSIFPNGIEKRQDHVALYLGREDDGSPKTVDVSLGIKMADGVEERCTGTRKLPHEDGRHILRGTDSFIPRSDLTQRKSQLMPSGALTVTCTLTVDVRHLAEGEKVRKENKCSQTDADEGDTDSEYNSEKVRKENKGCQTDAYERDTDSEYNSEKLRKENKSSQTDADEGDTDSEFNTLQKLQKDFENLFKSGEDCDVTIKVQNKEFHAHRSILRSRSPVFKSMFSHETQENLSGVVVIDDCDPETFSDFLNYLYSGSTKHINEKNVCHLFTSSDKYQVDELKEACAKFMKSHLSVDTFCDFMTVSLIHSVQELIDSATVFFCSNAEEIVKTVKWQIFLKDNLTVGNELFLKLLSRVRNI